MSAKVFVSFILMVAVAVANAYCVCATGPGGHGGCGAKAVSAAAVAPAGGVHEGCHGHAVEVPAATEPHHSYPSSCPRDDGQHDEHNCNHCLATVTMEKSSTPLGVADHAVFLPVFWAVAGIGSAFDSDPVARRVTFATDLPPPVGPPTLLSLFCSLTV